MRSIRKEIAGHGLPNTETRRGLPRLMDSWAAPGLMDPADRDASGYLQHLTETRHLPARSAMPITRKPSVAVLGAGHGGLALAGFLARHGHRVALWNRSAERIAGVMEIGGLRLALPGAAAMHTPLEVVTSEIAEAVSAVRVVLVAVPASGHAEVARACAPHLKDGQTVLLLPGRTGGALEFRRILREAGCHAKILLGEANSFPFAARCVGSADAVIYGAKDELLAAALPASRTPELIAACLPLLPMLAAAPSVLHTGLANLGAILHPVIALSNAERIERGDCFDFYTDGVTAQAAELLTAADAERLSIARAYGVEVQSLPEWIAAAYGHQAKTMQATVGGNPAYVGIKAPNTLHHRYLLEDVPTGLVPLIELGEAAGLDLPVLRSLVNLARVKLGGERWQSPRSLKALGLAGMDAEEIREFVARGVAGKRPVIAQTLYAPATRWAQQEAYGPV